MLPAFAGSVYGLRMGLQDYSVRDAILVMDEADAIFSSSLRRDEAQHVIESVGLTALEVQLYGLLGYPRPPPGGGLSKLGAGNQVGTLIWVSATHLATIGMHATWQQPFKVCCLIVLMRIMHGNNKGLCIAKCDSDYCQYIHWIYVHAGTGYGAGRA